LASHGPGAMRPAMATKRSPRPATEEGDRRRAPRRSARRRTAIHHWIHPPRPPGRGPDRRGGVDFHQSCSPRGSLRLTVLDVHARRAANHRVALRTRRHRAHTARRHAGPAATVSRLPAAPVRLHAVPTASF
jgi:hypothetical protein